MIGNIFYTNIYIFFCPRGWDQSYTGFLHSSFSCSVQWSSITDYKFSKSCVLLLPHLWSQWWQLDIIWANYSRSFPLLISLWRRNGFTFLFTKSHVHPQMCSASNVWSVTTECLRWPEQVREGASDDWLHAHTARACSLLHRLHWLHSMHKASLRSTWASGWLLTSQLFVWDS